MGNVLVETEMQQTPGQMLKAAREAKQISVGEVAQSLLLGKHTIMALENDDYSKIFAEIYAEGYLKAYAKLLQIPVENVLNSFHRLNLYSDVELKAVAKPKEGAGLRDQRILLGLLGFLILSMLLLVIFKHLGKEHAEDNMQNHELQTLVPSGSPHDSGIVIDKEQLSVTTDAAADSISDLNSASGAEINNKNFVKKK